jgi:hypothetical protein
MFTKIKITFFLIVLFCSGILAQTVNEFSSVDNTMLQIPDSSTKSTQSIARFIDRKFTNQNDKIRAVFYWVAKNIQYDIKNMYVVDFLEDKKELIDKVLRTRKAVCFGYAVLFCEIANKAGIKSCVVEGFTKQNGKVDYVSHVWCAAYINSGWYLFDPTWGSGGILNSKFVSQLSDYYFKTTPVSLIKSHIPFDLQWQFLNYPVTFQEFYQGKTDSNPQKKLFNFNDSIAAYEKQTEIEQLITAIRRIEENGGAINSIIFEKLQYNKGKVEYINNKLISEQFNSVVNNFNTGINLLNEFINYRNKQFTPIKPDSELKLMLDNIETSFNLAKENINQIKNPDSNILSSINQLNKSINEAYQNLDEQKTFLEKYLLTGKLFRKSLFYKYIWMEIPIN